MPSWSPPLGDLGHLHCAGHWPSIQFSSVQFLSCVQLFVTPWTAACQASLSITNSWSLLKLMPIESVMPSNHLILCVHFSSHLQSFPESGSFPMNQFFISGSQSIGVSASASATHPLPRNHLVSGRCSFLFGLWVTSQSDSSLIPSPWLYLDHLHPNSDSSAYLIFFFAFSHPSFAWPYALPGFWEWQETLSLPLKWPVVHPVTGFHDCLSDLAWTSPITYYHSGDTGQPDPAHPVVLVGTLHLLVEHWLQDYPGSSQRLVLNSLRDLL